MPGMAKDKVTITLDRAKADKARKVFGAKTTSQAVDMALDQCIYLDMVRRDIEGYRKVPQTEEELAIASAGAHPRLDDTDWEALYADVLNGQQPQSAAG